MGENGGLWVKVDGHGWKMTVMGENGQLSVIMDGHGWKRTVLSEIERS